MIRTTWVGIVMMAAAACAPPERGADLTDAHRAAIADSVLGFAHAMADDVTARGAAAWRPWFADTAAFYMAAEGSLVLPSSDSATALINQLATILRHIELRWEPGLRVDVLGPGLASLAGPYYELRIDTAGTRAEEHGYFTGVVAHRAAGWQLLSAHWSVRAGP